MDTEHNARVIDEHTLYNAALRRQYDRAGFAGRVGWGDRPALLVIDMARAWVDPTQQLGSDLSAVLRSIVRLLSAARAAGVPIYFTTMAYDSPAEVGGVVMKRAPERSGAVMAIQSDLGKRPGAGISIHGQTSRCERWRATMSVHVVFPTPPFLWTTTTTTGEVEVIVGSTPGLLSASVTVGASRSVSSLNRGN